MMSGQLSILLVGSIAFLALLLVLWQFNVSRRLGRELDVLRQELSQQSQQPEVNADFSSHLDRVEREQRVVEVPRSSSEKYQYAASLADQGVDTEGIAAALKMAPAEVEQLLKLSQLRRQVQG
jgi:L-fucose isomerase-like protein